MRRVVRPVMLGLLVCLLGSSPVRAQSGARTTAAATVNGDTITLDEVDAILKARPPLTPLTAAQQRQQRIDVVTTLVDDLLIRQFMRQQGPKVDPAEVRKSLAALEASLKAQNRTLADYLKEANQTEAQLQANLLVMLQMAKYVKANSPEAELRKYHEANRDFFDKTTVRVSHIVLRVGPSASPAERQAARERLERLRSDIVAGKIAFPDAAKANSECPSAPKGGDLGFIVRKWQVDEAFARAAFALVKPGDISGVVETDFGLHLIQLAERKPGTSMRFEGCEDEVRECYTEELRQALLTKLREKSRIEITLP